MPSSKQNNNTNNEAELKRQIESLQQKVNKLFAKNKSLEERVDVLENTKRKLSDKVEALESKMAVCEVINSNLSIEVDRLDQYTRRSNMIIKNMDLPDDPKQETNEDIKKLVKKVIKDDLKLPDSIFDDVDKFHRNGLVKNNGNKKTQNVIVRFKSHNSRYVCLMKKKEMKYKKIAPNLTRKRSKLLFDTSTIIKDKLLTQIEFAFANIHGDLHVRLAEPIKGSKVHPFNSMKQLDDFLLDNNVISESCFC